MIITRPYFMFLDSVILVCSDDQTKNRIEQNRTEHNDNYASLFYVIRSSQ